MPKNLSIDDIIAQFAEDLEAAIRLEVHERIRAYIVGQRTAPAGKRGGKAAPKIAPSSGRRIRRSADQLADVQKRIVELLGKEPKLSSEELQEKLNLSKEAIQRPLQLLRESGEVKSLGERRSMRYYVGAGKPGVVKRAKAGAAE